MNKHILCAFRLNGNVACSSPGSKFEGNCQWYSFQPANANTTNNGFCPTAQPAWSAYRYHFPLKSPIQTFDWHQCYVVNMEAYQLSAWSQGPNLIPASNVTQSSMCNVVTLKSRSSRNLTILHIMLASLCNTSLCNKQRPIMAYIMLTWLATVTHRAAGHL